MSTQMRDELQSLFCLKINVEYQKFKKEQLELSVEEIYGNAYSIQFYMCIYESLLELSQKLSEDVLATLVTFPNLLTYLFERWLKVEDSLDEELNDFLEYKIIELHKENVVEKGEQAA